jgi:adenylate cyclase
MYGEMIPVGGGDTIPLLKTELLVGRRETCDICLRFANVSAHHCQLSLRNGYWYVKDMNSSNGTKINGARVDEKRINPGDTISVAKHAYKFDYSPADLGAVGPPPPETQGMAEQMQILGKSLLERAGLDRKAREAGREGGRETSREGGRYDLGNDKGGNFRDPNRPV